jgi:hypothetical protein
LIADPAACARLGSAGPARARQLCDPAAALARLEELLGRVVAPSKQAPGGGRHVPGLRAKVSK